MAFQLWLADVLRDAGLTVHEVAGWRNRSADEDSDASTFRPHGVIIHETRGSATSSDAGEIGVLVNGRTGLSGPIAQLYVGRDGHWHVVAAGLCHHVKTGWGGPFSDEGNTRLLGIEPAHSADEDWADKPAQYQSYVAGVAAILNHTGWPAPVGHKEHQPGDKPDPEFNMDTFRLDVAAAREDDMAQVKQADFDALIWRVEALIHGRDKVIGGPTKGEAVYVVQRLRGLPMGDPNFAAAMYRLEALTKGLDVVRDGPTEGEPVVPSRIAAEVHAALDRIEAALAAEGSGPGA